jgi:UDPglucose 6-dehydrogenase
MKIGIIGNGFVGKATRLFECDHVQIYVYDIIPELCHPYGTSLSDMEKCDLIFICVPTPLNETGECQVRIIDSIIEQLNNQFIVIRSTVPVGYCTHKNCFFMPEFLTELNWEHDFINNKNWIVGLLDHNDCARESQFISLIYQLISYSYESGKIHHNKVIFCKNEEAEMLKLVKNSFFAAKVGFFNEIFDLSRALNVDYEHLIELVSLDERIGSSHIKVPGPPDVRNIVKRGFGGTCLPKDTNSIYNLLINNDINSLIIQNVLYRNEYIDRRERDWLQDKGRAVSRFQNVYLICGDESLDICISLLKNENNIIISLFDHEIEHENYRFKKNHSKLFFPQIDGIYYYTSNKTQNFNDLKNQCTLLINLIELSELHQCKIYYRGDDYFTQLYYSSKKYE